MKNLKNKIEAIALKAQFPVKKIDLAYNKRLQSYLYWNSHKKDKPKDTETGNHNLEFNKNGFIINAQFSEKTKSGFDLLEVDFINENLQKIKTIDLSGLNLDEVKYIDFLKDFFKNKLNEAKATGKKQKPKKRKGIFTKHHVISFIMECKAKGEPLPIGRTKWEEAGFKRKNYTGSDDRFYRVYNDDLQRLYFDKEVDLIETIGENWQDIVIELAEDPKALKDYLKQHFI